MINNNRDFGNPLPISWAANGAMKWDGGMNSWAVYGVMGLNQQSWIKRNSAVGTAVTKPAETVMLAGRFNGNDCYGMGTFMVGVNWWDWPGSSGAPGQIPDGAAQDVNGVNRTGGVYSAGSFVFNKNDHFGGVTVVYAGQTPFVYADGHAKMANPVSTNPDSRNRPAENQWDAYR
jgi:hypothetical protein